VKFRRLRWIPPVIAVLALLGCDAPPPDPVVRLKQVFAERPAVADADNAFLDVFGFAAPAGTDPHELGVRRLAWLEKYNVDRRSAGADPGMPGLNMKAHRSQALEQVIDACRAAIARACGSALDRVKGGATLSEIEPLLLDRYQVLLGRTGWRETGTPYAETTLPSYEGAIEAQRLMLIRLRNAAAAGDVEKVRAMLSRDLTYWRMALASSDFLLSKMIALAAIRQHFALGSYVLRDLPADRVMGVVPAQWRVAFSDAERSILRPMSGEIRLAEQMFQAGGGSGPESDYSGDAGQSRAPLDRLVNRMAQKVRQPKFRDVADYFLSAAEGFQAPLPEYEAVSMKLRSRYASSDVAWDLSQYAMRIGSAEGMRRAALLTVELRSQSVPVAELSAKLKDSPLRNPYTGQPFDWDEADQAIVFIGPESRKYKRQAYPY
jgi:hypothetical protein